MSFLVPHHKYSLHTRTVLHLQIELSSNASASICTGVYSGTLLDASSRPNTMRRLAKRKSFICSCTRAGARGTTTPHTPRRKRSRNVTSYLSSSRRYLQLFPACHHSRLKTIQVSNQWMDQLFTFIIVLIISSVCFVCLPCRDNNWLRIFLVASVCYDVATFVTMTTARENGYNYRFI